MFQPLIALATYMAGEFENREQAIADPAWYVHLKLWQRPIPAPLFAGGIGFFAEQASLVNGENRTYRPRILHLFDPGENPETLRVQYYMPEDFDGILGAGRDRDRLKTLTPDQLELLPTCALDVTWERLEGDAYRFRTAARSQCRFTYKNQTYRVDLGFEATPEQFLSFDRGIDPETGQATWGALLGPYQFIKNRDFSAELPADFQP
ncbi:chromophore lyase CpcT/CpeT [Lyngbya sp. CCY1209]|uniref:chromophore lyase CpcT/CpeT n=1 Tax=Lyngbya sp. CCY1209 TaxID=2886103 RepID=UPI002D202113|nr:chromophore lyase CpcT/CpeT [Lyngbya sp. CCY1209]MEB3882887.1 chromophore lyase CpcT/CpeT [Lyngbya sp. CCY1209]